MTGIQGHQATAADILGRQVRLRGVPRAIVGVMPEGFHYPNDGVAWERWMQMVGERLVKFDTLRLGVSTVRR